MNKAGAKTCVSEPVFVTRWQISRLIQILFILRRVHVLIPVFMQQMCLLQLVVGERSQSARRTTA